MKTLRYCNILKTNEHKFNSDNCLSAACNGLESGTLNAMDVCTSEVSMKLARKYLDMLPKIGLNQLLQELEANSKDIYHHDDESTTYVLADNSEVYEDKNCNLTTYSK